MLNDWSLTTLGEVAHVEMGQSPPSAFVSEREVGLAFLQGNAEFSDLHPQPKLWCRKPAKTAIAGDALISVRAPVGALNRADQDYCIGRGLAAIRFGTVDPNFGYHALGLYANALRRVAQGTTFEAVGGTELRQLEFPDAPAPEQRRIAAILDTIDEAIRRTEQVIGKLHQMKQGLLHDLLTRGIDENGELRDPEHHPEQFKDSPLGQIPDGWQVAPFEQYSWEGRPFLKTGPFGSSLKGEHWTDAGVPVITIGALGEGEFVESELLFVSARKAAELSAYAVVPGDIVFSRVADVGRSVVVKEAQTSWIMSSNLMWISLDPGAVQPEFVWMSLSGNAVVRQQVRRSVNAGGREVANGSVLRSLQLAWPDLPEQQRIVDAGGALQQREIKEGIQLGKLRALKHGLMDDLLTGRVRTLSS